MRACACVRDVARSPGVLYTATPCCNSDAVAAGLGDQPGFLFAVSGDQPFFLVLGGLFLMRSEVVIRGAQRPVWHRHPGDTTLTRSRQRVALLKGCRFLSLAPSHITAHSLLLSQTVPSLTHSHLLSHPRTSLTHSLTHTGHSPLSLTQTVPSFTHPHSLTLTHPRTHSTHSVTQDTHSLSPVPPPPSLTLPGTSLPPRPTYPTRSLPTGPSRKVRQLRHRFGPFSRSS